MELKNDEAVSHAGVGADSSVGNEIDLYDELVTFAELSPEQRVLAKAKPAPAKAEPSLATTLQTPETASKPTKIPTLDIELEPASGNHHAAQPRETNDDAVENFAQFENSDHPGGSNAEALFAGALTRGVCLACGADSGVNDVFCVSCGEFVDEAEPTLVLLPTCPECGLGASDDELFCPRCGAVMPAY